MPAQTFIQTSSEQWLNMDRFPGTQFLPLAEPVAEGSIQAKNAQRAKFVHLASRSLNDYVVKI